MILASVRRVGVPPSVPAYANARLLLERREDGGFDPRLLLPDGESFPVGNAAALDGDMPPTGNLFVRLAAGKSAAVSAGNVFYADLRHDGQPYPDLDNPGAFPSDSS